MITNNKAKSQTSENFPLPAADAIALLKADHKAVAGLFADYEDARSATRKKAIVSEICTALTLHIQIEEEIFYPDVKAVISDKLMIPEATVEHAGVKALIDQLEGVEPGGELYDARVRVLAEYVKHHVKEEHNEMFPKVKESSLDLVELGMRMAARKNELMSAKN